MRLKGKVAIITGGVEGLERLMLSALLKRVLALSFQISSTQPKLNWK